MRVGVVSLLPGGGAPRRLVACLRGLGHTPVVVAWSTPSLVATIAASGVRHWVFSGSPAQVGDTRPPSFDVPSLLRLPGKAFLFVCYSHQWLCKSLGARVLPVPWRHEVGCSPVRATAAGLGDAALSALVKPQAPAAVGADAAAAAAVGADTVPVFCNYTRYVPALGAPRGWRVLAADFGGHAMALRCGPHLSVQFHPEVRREGWPLVAAWLAEP